MFYPGPPPPRDPPNLGPGLYGSWALPGLGELFPPHKTALLQQVLERHSDSGYMVGLEYVVEVRPVREGEPWYSCTLCDQEFRIKPGEETSSKRRLTRHLGLMSHKLNFLQKHFPRVKRLTLEAPENICTERGVDRVVRKVQGRFGHMKIRLVVGNQLYDKSRAEIHIVIENGPHFKEEEEFVESFAKSKRSSAVRDSTESKKSNKKKLRQSRSQSNEKERKSKTPTVKAKSTKRRSRSKDKERKSKTLTTSKDKRSRSHSKDKGRTSKTTKNNRSSSESDDKERKDITPTGRKQKRSRSRSCDRQRYSRAQTTTQSKRSESRSFERNKKSKSPNPLTKKQQLVPTFPKKKVAKSRKRQQSSSASPSPSPPSKTRATQESRHKKKKNRQAKSESRSPNKVKKKRKDHSESPPPKVFAKVLADILTKPDPIEERHRQKFLKQKQSKSPSPAKPKPPSGGEDKLVIGVRSYSSSPSPVRATAPAPASPDVLKVTKLRNNMGEKIQKFFAFETLMLDSLAVEKSQYYAAPSSHPSYQPEWEKFWRRQQEECAVTNVGGQEMERMVETKWVLHWKDFFDRLHEKKMQERRVVLLARHGVTASDIETYMLDKAKEAEVITLESSEEEERVVSPWEEQKAGGAARNRDPKLRRSSSISAPRVPRSVDVSVLATLRLLSSLDAGGCLGSGLSSRLDQLKETALGLEAGAWGSSEALVTARECSSLLDQARERLAGRLELSKVGAGHREAARIALDNIGVLLGRVGVQREEVLEIEEEGREEAAIRRRLQEELSTRGAVVTPRELSALVEAELVRARLSLAPALPDAAITASNLFSVYRATPPQPASIDWAAVSNIVSSLPHPQSQEPQPSTSAGSSKNTASSSSSGRKKSPDRVPDIKTEELDALTEVEVVQLVRNFRSLDKEDQKELIAYMRKLEESDPDRVQKLRRELYL